MKGKMLASLAAVLLTGLLALPVKADVASRGVPGALNYVEGQASMGTQSLTQKSVGSSILEPNETLTTAPAGKAEILLTPGVFLRLGGNGAVKMISPSLTNTQVEIQRGEAQVEVDQLYKQNNLQVLEDGATIQMEKNGVYDFNADQRVVRVLDGEAKLREGDTAIKIKGGHEVLLNGAALKSQKFDKNQFTATDDLYRWSSLRSAYLAQANADQARTYIVNGGFGPGWYGAGWYWDPWFSAYTFIPGDGFLYSPFGWGFYSPYWAYRLPAAYGGYHTFGYAGWGPGPHYGPWYHGVTPVGPGHGWAGYPHGEMHAGGWAGQGWAGGGARGGWGGAGRGGWR